MSTIIRLQRMVAGATVASAILIAMTVASHAVAAPAGGESFTAMAADLKRITGSPIEIHATPVIAQDPFLPVICRAITDGFRDAAGDPETNAWLGRIVQVVVIDGWSAGQQNGHVDLRRRVLTIRTMTGEAEINNLRLLVAETLKKVAHLKAKLSIVH